jgi:hypothetical protein
MFRYSSLKEIILIPLGNAAIGAGIHSGRVENSQEDLL